MDISGFVWIIILSLAVFLICREVVCWYFKLTKIADLLEEQNSLLREMRDSDRKEEVILNNSNAKVPFKESFKSLFKIKRCPKCNRANSFSSTVCSGCGTDI